jgi:methenyltetrahydrofolate cyclohydrolase
MPRFADLSISAFVDALASPQPTPGGGTVAALAGAMGASLLMMVSGLPKTRGKTEAERAALGKARAAIEPLRNRLLALADEDAEAYDRVVAAYRLAKGTDEEQRARKAAVQEAMRAATEAPLETLRVIAAVVEQAKTVAQFGNPSAASDVRVAFELLEAAAAGAAANVETNLTSLDDAAYRKKAASIVIELTNALTEHIASARVALAPEMQAG